MDAQERPSSRPRTRDGTTHVMFELLDFIAHLAAMVPKSRVNLTHNHDLYFRAVLLIRVAAD